MQNKRVRYLNQQPITTGSCVIYVMSRDQRVRDNHALVYAQTLALQQNVPLLVVFRVLSKSGYRAKEHYAFMFDGLRQVEKCLHKLNVGFQLAYGNSKQFTEYLIAEDPCALVFDFSPLTGPQQLQNHIASKLHCQVSVIDTHNIIPVWVASDKQEYAAHTFRRAVHKQLASWLVEPTQLQEHPNPPQWGSADWSQADAILGSLPTNATSVEFDSGEEAALSQLDSFVYENLSSYHERRNDPTQSAQSHLSPYLHFGQLSAIRIALHLQELAQGDLWLLQEFTMPKGDRLNPQLNAIDAYLEELIVRKELSDNFCFYAESYIDLRGAADWALKTLDEHRNDFRKHTYSRDEFEQAKTHDAAWNAAQIQLLRTGKIHGYMRMYWAKKILEWSVSPEEAIQIAIYLNDRYSIDGGDPNGYVGILWSIAGVHDRAWPSHPVYGKIRYMNESGLRHKFALEEYIKQYQGQ